MAVFSKTDKGKREWHTDNRKKRHACTAKERNKLNQEGQEVDSRRGEVEVCAEGQVRRFSLFQREQAAQAGKSIAAGGCKEGSMVEEEVPKGREKGDGGGGRRQRG